MGKHFPFHTPIRSVFNTILCIISFSSRAMSWNEANEFCQKQERTSSAKIWKGLISVNHKVLWKVIYLYLKEIPVMYKDITYLGLRLHNVSTDSRI